MQTKDSLIQFEKKSEHLVERAIKAKEAKDYWKAQRILRSLQKSENNMFLFKFAADLHLKMQGYQNVEEDFLPLLFSHEFEAIMYGARGLVQHFLQIDSDKAEFYSEFVKNRLKEANVKMEESFFEEVLSYVSKKNRFSFVEKKDGAIAELQEADRALASGQLDVAISSASKVSKNSESGALASKIASEAYLHKKDFKNAKKELENTTEKDAYYYSLLLQIQHAQKDKAASVTIKKLLAQTIESEVQLMVVLDALLATEKYDIAEQVILQNESKFEYFCPLYIAKWLVYYAKKDMSKVRENLLKVCVLDKRKVVEQEILWCLDDNVKLPNKITINDSYPQVILDRAKQRIETIMQASVKNLQKFTKSELENGFFWVEIFGNSEIALEYVRQILLCKTGVQIVRECLLSFVSADWLKKVCIGSLVEVGAHDLTIWYVCDDIVDKSKILIPEIVMKDAFVQPLAENEEFLVKFAHVFGMAFANLCFEANDFENRLQEVGEEWYRAFVGCSKNKKLDKNLLLAAILFSTCSDKVDIQFASPKVECSKYSTIENVCAEFDVPQDKLENLIKNVL